MPGRRPAGLVAPAGPRAGFFVARCERAGIPTQRVDAPGAAPEPGTLLWGSPEAWLARWSVLAAIRAEGDLIVDAACTAEYRTLTGRRDLPPYALPGADRAWRVTPDGRVARVRLA